MRRLKGINTAIAELIRRKKLERAPARPASVTNPFKPAWERDVLSSAHEVAPPRPVNLLGAVEAGHARGGTGAAYRLTLSGVATAARHAAAT